MPKVWLRESIYFQLLYMRYYTLWDLVVAIRILVAQLTMVLIEKYNELTGLSETSLTIENDGGAGTALAHWEEDIFDNEIMTGWSESGTAEEPMSEVTVAAFDDYGYEVKYDVADEWNGAGTGIGTTPLLISRVSSVKSAIQSMAETRAKIGSQITYTKNIIDALAIEGENLEKSVSKISDVDSSRKFKIC